MLRTVLFLWWPLLVAWPLGMGGVALVFVAGAHGWIGGAGLFAYALSLPIGMAGIFGAIEAVRMAWQIDPDGEDVLQRNVLWLQAPLLLGMSLLWAVLPVLVMGLYGTFYLA